MRAMSRESTMPRRLALAWLLLPLASAIAGTSGAGDAWRPSLVKAFGRGPSRAVAAAVKQFPGDRARLAAVADWVLQDKLDGKAGLLTEAVLAAADALGDGARDLRAQLSQLAHDNAPPTDPRWVGLYLEACERRRAARLATHRERLRRVVFTRHYDFGGSHYAYTEGQSDAQRERHFKPGGSLCLLDLDGLYGTVRTLLDDPKGVVRDPDVSFDATRILFAWKKGLKTDDYHLYEMTPADGTTRQLTHGLGFADYEAAYLPDGDIVFNSTRCVQTVDCWWTEVSNLYTCDADGRYLRRLSYDQVHTNYPTVAPDGRVLYTRWDYSDRGQIYPQGLFQMNPDGTSQTAVYGNNSWFPTTILHARGIPHSGKLVAVLSGHHCHQRGKLALIDPYRGRQEADGVRLIAPDRPTEPVHVDAYGQEGDQFQYPYPLNESEFLVTYSPDSGGNRQYKHPYGIHWMHRDARRELLVWDPAVSCNQSIPLAPRKRPTVRPSQVDPAQKTGVYYLQNIYAGPGLAGVPRGSIKSLRVVALEFRAAGIGEVRNHGPGGGALASTPIGIGNTSWDVKVVLGEAPVHPDGSALFEVPARTPLYFQALDKNGHMVQTMRSWSTLQPGEKLSCVGCHESKNHAPPTGPAQTLAMAAGVQPLKSFYGPPRGFSFNREIQPILDRHCIRCHNDRPDLHRRIHLTAWPPSSPLMTHTPDVPSRTAFSLLSETVHDERAKRYWSDAYLALTHAHRLSPRDPLFFQGDQDHPLVNWINCMSVPSLLQPYSAGAARSGLIHLLKNKHGNVSLSPEEMNKIACWIDLVVPFCGNYTEANAWTESERQLYRRFLDKRRRMERLETGYLNPLVSATMSN